MGCDQHVGKCHEPGQQLVPDDLAGMILEKHAVLFLVHVQPHACQLAGNEPLNEGIRLDKAAPGRIHQQHALLHLRNRLFIHNISGVICQWTVQADDIRPGQQLRQRHVLHIQTAVRERVVGYHMHTKPLTDGDHGLTDLASADDARRLPVQILAHKAVDVHVKIPGSRVRPMGKTVHRQQQRRRILRHRLGRIAGHPQDFYFALRRPDIHMVKSGTAQQHRLHAVFIQNVDHLRIDGVVDEHADGIVSFGKNDCLRRTLDVQEGDLIPVIRRQRFKPDLVVGFCPVK